MSTKVVRKPSINSGFTLIELMVVISIMAIMATIVVINLAGQRSTRDLNIAENELVSNIRAIQSNTLSDRVLPNGQDVQYYILKFDLTNPTQYKIQAIYNATSNPQMVDVQTINLPANIFIASTTSAVYPISISRALNPTLQPIYTNCALIAFAAPFAKVIFNDGCAAASPPTLQLSDDYYSKLINFQNNVACDGNNGNPPVPAVCSASTDSTMTITLTDLNKTQSRTIIINGITGAVTFD